MTQAHRFIHQFLVRLASLLCLFAFPFVLLANSVPRCCPSQPPLVFHRDSGLHRIRYCWTGIRLPLLGCLLRYIIGFAIDRSLILSRSLITFSPFSGSNKPPTRDHADSHGPSSVPCLAIWIGSVFLVMQTLHSLNFQVAVAKALELSCAPSSVLAEGCHKNACEGDRASSPHMRGRRLGRTFGFSGPAPRSRSATGQVSPGLFLVVNKLLCHTSTSGSST